jgi:hypothetical protein
VLEAACSVLAQDDGLLRLSSVTTILNFLGTNIRQVKPRAALTADAYWLRALNQKEGDYIALLQNDILVMWTHTYPFCGRLWFNNLTHWSFGGASLIVGFR